jgi:hypothetical protein
VGRFIAMMWWLLLGAACTAISEPRDQPDDFYPSGLFFGSPSEPMFADATFPPRMRVRPSRLIVLGKMGTPCNGFAGEGAVDVFADTVTLRVATYWAIGHYGCSARIDAVWYRASIDLTPGSYVVRIRHEPLDAGFGFAQDTVVVVR